MVRSTWYSTAGATSISNKKVTRIVLNYLIFSAIVNYTCANNDDSSDVQNHSENSLQDSADELILENTIPQFQQWTAQKRRQQYSFGLGKKSDDGFESENVRDYLRELNKRHPNDFSFGLGKRGPKDFSFGLGKRGPKDFSFGLGKRGPKDFSFGLGKRGPKDYSFGLGKRGPKDFSFGLGKRNSRDYSFGLGKREPKEFSFGLGKRDPGSFSFGLGKRNIVEDEDDVSLLQKEGDVQDVVKRSISLNESTLEETGSRSKREADYLIPEDLMDDDEFEEEKRKNLYQFGLGKRIGQEGYIPYLDIPEDYNLDSTEIDKRAPTKFSFGLGKRNSNKFQFGLGKRTPNTYGFGLGKRDKESQTRSYYNPFSHLFSAYPSKYGFIRRSYDFGLGKRSGNSKSDNSKKNIKQYSFGLGKRSTENLKLLPRSYNFGLGKRSSQFYQQDE